MREINAMETREYIQGQKEGLVLNVLPKKSFRQAHIPKSYNVPVKNDGFVKKVDSISAGKNEPIVTYCANEECNASREAAEKLEQAGYTNVMDFTGGIKEWREHDLKLSRP